jgi:TPR repeat protein
MMRVGALIVQVSLSAFIALVATPAHADDLPLARDGSVDRAIYNGQQNMPVRLFGVAQDWHQRCFQGRVSECMRLAEAFATGLGDLRANTRISAGYFLKACESGSGASCGEYAALALGGSLTLPSPEPAVTSARRGCNELDDQRSCAWLALLYSRGEELAKDIAQADILWRTACSAGSDDGCRFLANHLSGEAPQGSAQQKEGFALFERECAAASRPWACLGAARARGVSTAGAIELLERGCKQGDGDRLQVCGEFAAQTIGRSDSDSVDFAEGILNSSCTAGIAKSCYLIGRHGFSANARLGDVTPGEAGFYLRRGCDLGHAAACHDLARAYIDGRMRKEQYFAQVMLMIKSCELGYGPACEWTKADNSLAMRPVILTLWIDPSLPAAEQLEQAISIADTEPRKAAQTVGLLMEEQYEEAEWLLGNWFLTGKRGIVDSPNERDGVTLIENAAKVGHVEAAKWMGMAHWYGRNGVSNDRTLGLGYMRIAARFGDEEALLLVRSMELQPERDRIAAQRAAAEQARIEREQRHWFSRWAETVSFSRPTVERRGISLSAQMAAESNRRHVAAMDKLYWNQRVEYLTGATTACNRSNPYC